MMKTLENIRNVSALEVNKVDFLYFNANNMVSTTSNDLLKELMKRQGSDIVFIDLNDYEDTEICTQVYYLLEPSTIMMNKMLRKNRNILETLKNKNIILNRCVLNSTDIATFEYETKLKVFATVPPVDERQSIITPVKNLIDKMGL